MGLNFSEKIDIITKYKMGIEVQNSGSYYHRTGYMQRMRSVC